MEVVLVVEDYQWGVVLTEILRRYFPELSPTVFTTEHAFTTYWQGVTRPLPRLAILGMRIAWAEAAPNVPLVPTEVLDGGVRRGGYRCFHQIRAKLGAGQLPVLFYTATNYKEMHYLELANLNAFAWVDSGEQPIVLVEAIKKLLQKYPPAG